MAEDGRSRLGRGLAALIGDVGEETKIVERSRHARKAPIEFIKPNPRNPRRNFSDAELDELADSIKKRGIIQPIVVRAVKGRYRPVRDHRRRTALARGATRRPARGADRHRSRRPTARRSNLRSSRTCSAADLNPLEEAMGYQSLIDQYNHSQDDVAKFVGKSRSHVTNTLRLLQLSDTVKAYIRSGQLTAGHARMLVGQPNADELARRHRQPRTQRAPGRSARAQGRPCASAGGQR